MGIPGALLAMATLGAAVAATLALTAPRADIVDATAARTIAVGDGGAVTSCERGDPGRTGRARAFPSAPRTRWSRQLGGRIDYTPLVGADGGIVVLDAAGGATGLESLLLELDARDGATRATTRLPDAPAGPPVLLANGVRVVVTQRGEAIGVDHRRVGSAGIRFRTPLGGEFATSISRVGIVPLATGGVAIARRGDLAELDGEGAIVGRAHLELTPALAARANGEVVGVTPSGDLYMWRAGRVPRLVGAFGDRGGMVGALGVGGHVCPAGPVVDDELARGGHGRAICVLGSESLVEQIDLVTGARRALLAHPVLPFRTPPALGPSGEVAIGSVGAAVSGVNAAGVEYGPVHVSGALLGALGRDAGVLPPASGELAPLIDPSGTVLFGGSAGVSLLPGDGAPVALARCGGTFAATVAGVASAGDGLVVVACVDGRVELVGDAPSAPPKPGAHAASAN